MRRSLVAGWWCSLWILGACGQATLTPNTPPSPQATSQPGLARDGGVEAESGHRAADAQPTEAGADVTTLDATSDAETPRRLATEPCPEGMQLVDTQYCPRIERRCVDEEYSPQNHIIICHKFAKTQRCLVPEEHRRFCIDTYEYPNRKGAHPPWMVSWYDAQATCTSLGKRTCYESEWVAACEGPEQTPFPYGHARDNAKCNIDNQWISPNLGDLYRSDSQTKLRELSRLDQSAPSGAMTQCVSGFGVHDMTGNFDEWVTADERHDDKSEWAALKGGAWGHVRNACRPVTTSHPPDFTYYFITFRCCADVAGEEPYTPKVNTGKPTVPPGGRAPEPVPVGAPGPSPIKVGRDLPKPKTPRGP